MTALLLGGGFLVFWLVVIVIAVAINYIIMGKTGYNPWLALLCLIPGVGGLIILIMLAFTEWPLQREVKMLRAQVAGAGAAGAMPGVGYAASPPVAPYGSQLPPPGTPPATT